MSSIAETSVSSEAAPGKDTPDLETLAEDFRLALERKRETDRLFDHHTEEVNRLELATSHASEVARGLRARLVREIIEASDVRIGDGHFGPVDWYEDPSPVCQATIGGKLYVVAKAPEMHNPNTLEQLPDHCTLVIIPVETEGGVR